MSQKRTASSKRVADTYMGTQTSTLPANRLRLLEMDEALATSFRDKVITMIRSGVSSISEGSPYSPQTHLDGDRKLHIQIPAWPGKHPQMLFVVHIPSEVFYQFGFAKGSVNISESYGEHDIDVPDITKAKTTGQVAEMLLDAIQKYIDSGGEGLAPHSGIPTPKEV